MRGDGFFVPIAVVFFAAAALILPMGKGVGESSSPSAPQASASSASAETSAERPPNVETAETLLGQFFGEPVAARSSQESIDRLRDAARTHGYAVDTLIATVPDPIDSNSRWQFDPTQDAIQRAAGADGLVLDRFFIPDWKAWVAEKDRGKERGRLHEAWPGVILFRGTGRLLVTFLVFETPTQGIHLDAFRQAVVFADRWRNGQPGTLKILGPTFSGTSRSLRIGLTNAARGGLLKNADVQVVSGSATSPSNKAIIEGTGEGGGGSAGGPQVKVSYAATVLSSQDLLFGIVQHLQEHNQLEAGRLALLTEQNTSYGQSARQTHKDHDDKSREANESLEEHVLGSALYLGFPLHVSRLRAGADRIIASANASRGLVPQAGLMQSLSLKDEGLITDQMPMFGESTTPAYVELILVNILQTLRREKINTVALVATDTRDKLFLSQMLARYCPDVRVFMLEADLLYTHPDYSTYMRGALIASTYPLFNANQTWSASAEGDRRSQFATSNTQGVFNAFQVLRSADGRGDLTKMLEYRTPFGDRCAERGCAPPLWISVSGSSGMWPIDAVPVNSTYVHHVPATAKLDPAERDHARMLPVPTWAVVALLLLNVCAWTQCAGYLVGSRERWRGRWPLVTRLFGDVAIARRYLFTAFAALFLLLACIDLLASAWVSFVFEHHGRLWLAGALTVTAATLIALVVVMIDVARRRLPPLMGQITADRKAGFSRWMLTYRALFVILLGLTVWHLMLALYEAADVGAAVAAADVSDPPAAAARRALLLLLNRSLTLTNGVSPAVPVLLLCGALYFWGIQHFRPRGVPSRSAFRSRVAELNALRASLVPARPGTDAPDAKVQRLTVDGMTQLRTVVFAVAVAVQLFFYAGPGAGVSTIDSPSYTSFFLYASVLVQALIAVGLGQFLFAWAYTRRALDLMAGSTGVAGSLSNAFGRLPLSLRRVGMFSRVPAVRELEAAVARAEAVQQLPVEAGELSGEAAAMLGRQPEFQTDSGCPHAGQIREAFTADMQRDPGGTFSDATVWPMLLRFSAGVRERAAAVKTVGGSTPPDAVRGWLERADDLVALDIVLIVREMSARLVASMVLTLVLTLLVLTSHTWYPAQPRQMLMGFSWACILATAAASAKVFIQMDRNEIMSHISGTPVNRVTWDVALISKLLLWVVIPLLSLFAAQFPDAGSAILQWLQPVQKALP
jgi:hypothetical protein